MSSQDPGRPDSEDMFADTRMTFGEHIEDLRTHLLRAIYGFVIGFVIAVPLGKPVMNFISAPVELQLKLFNERYNESRLKEMRQQQLAGEMLNLPPIPMKLEVNVDEFVDRVGERLGVPPQPPAKRPALDHIMPAMQAVLASVQMDHLVDWRKTDETHYIELTGRIGDPIEYVAGFQKVSNIILPRLLSTLSVQEAFVVLFKVIMIVGLVIASPWVFYQIWAFIAAGLYPSEKRLVNVYLPFSLALFLIGVFVCQFLVIPKAIEAMLWFNEYLGFQPDLRLSEWLGFAIFMPVVFGVSFQTPLVMYFLEKIGILSVEMYKGKRRIAWFLLAIFAAVITPSVDALSMIFLWLPMCILYELGIWMCVFSARPSADKWETSETDEYVEV